MDVTFLGTAGWMPSEGRETACISVRVDDTLILLDAGTGVRRLVTEPTALVGVDSIHVLLSHFHLDHIIGLTYLSAIGGDIPVQVLGPGRWLYARGTREVLDAAFQPPYQPRRLGETPLRVEEVGADGVDIAGVRVRTRAQPRHTAPSVGYRLGDELAYVTDTAYDPGSTELVSGVGVLLHEAFAQTNGDPAHSSASEAARVAVDARCRALFLVHLAPDADESTLLEGARAVMPGASVSRDSQRYAIERGAGS